MLSNAVCITSRVRSISVVPLADLLEQPQRLDGDHRLIGESRHQLDLSRRERHRLVAGERENANRRAPRASKARRASRCISLNWRGPDQLYSASDLHVRNVHNAALQNGAGRIANCGRASPPGASCNRGQFLAK